MDKCSTPEKRGWGVIRKPELWARPKVNGEFLPYKIDTQSVIPDDVITYERNAWYIDNDIPIFTKDRDYILNLLPKK
jgi:hypothetical protein